MAARQNVAMADGKMRIVARVAGVVTGAMGKTGRTLTAALALAMATALARAQEAPLPPPLSETPLLESDTPRFAEPGREGEQGPDPSQVITRLLRLSDQGIAIDGTWIGDESINLFGGAKPGQQALQNLLNLSVEINLEKAVGWEGAQLFSNFQNHRGINAHTLAGDEQIVDQIDAIPIPERTQLSELWYRQDFFNDRARVKLGKMDANEDFAFVSNANHFIHNAFGNPTTILWLPSYPDTATGINLFVYPDKKSFVGFGLYDGSLGRGVHTGLLGPATFFQSPRTYFYIIEGGFNFEVGEDKLPGRIAAGYWWNNNEFAVFDDVRREPNDPLKPVKVAGTGGPYVVGDQTLWKEDAPKAPKNGDGKDGDGDSSSKGDGDRNGDQDDDDDQDDDQGIRGFYQFGAGDPDTNLFQYYFGGGVMWQGFYRKRNDDIVGFGIAYSKFSDKDFAFNPRRNKFRLIPHPANEIAYQGFYQCRLNQNLAVQPNVTYIVDPGESKFYRNTVIVTLRVLLDF